MANRFCVSLTHAKDNPDKATVAFVVANAALGSGKETLVFYPASRSKPFASATQELRRRGNTHNTSILLVNKPGLASVFMESAMRRPRHMVWSRCRTGRSSGKADSSGAGSIHRR